ncbi:MAG: hypothetical protein AB8F78_05785 [Saprospiraceae bacterium]
MKPIQIVLLFCIAVFGSSLTAQSTVQEWNQERLLSQRKAMRIKTNLGAVQTTIGTVGVLTNKDAGFKSLYGAAAVFGVGNSMVGLVRLFKIKKDLQGEMYIEDAYADLRAYRSRLLLGAGLNIGCIVTGVILIGDDIGDYRFRNRTGRQKGKGTGLLIQGVSSLIINLASFHSTHKSNNMIKIQPIFIPNGGGLGLSLDINELAKRT